jgi:hypothetical protein
MISSAKLFAPLALTVGIALATPASAAPNLVGNPSFSTFNGWENQTLSGNSNGIAANHVPEQNGSNGFFEFSVNGSGTIDFGKLLYGPISVTAGSFSLAMDVFSGGTQSGSWYMTFAGTTFEGLLSEFSGWKTITRTFNVPTSGDYKVEIGVKALGPGGLARFDNVDLQTVAVPGPEVGAIGLPAMAVLFAGYAAWRRRRAASV